MKNHLYTSLFSFFLKLFLVIFIFNIIIFFFFKVVFSISEFRLNKVFNGNYENIENIILGNSRSFSLIFDNKNKDIINFSYNEMTLKNIEQILQAIQNKSIDYKVYIEITSLIDENYNCTYHIFNFHKYFDNKIVKENCKIEYILTNYIPLYQFNSELFYRLLYYTIFKNDDQSYVSSDIYDKTLCKNNKIGFYNYIFLNRKTQYELIEKVKKIEKKFPTLNLRFFILPYHKGSKKLLKDFENEIYKKVSKKIIYLNRDIDNNFYNDCENFSDRLHLSKKGILKINIKNKIL